MKNRSKIFRASMRYLVGLCALFLFTSCFWNRPDRDLSKDELIAKKITFTVAKKLGKEKGFSFGGFGGGIDNGIEVMMMALDAPHAIDIAKGRAMIVECAEIYLEAINSNLEIRPYLQNYPFTFNNIEIQICASPKIIKTQVACVFLKRGKIYYYVEIGKSMKTAYEEPYETAVKKLQEEKKKSSTLQPRDN